MTQHQTFDTTTATPVSQGHAMAAAKRAEVESAEYEVWFGLAEEKLFKMAGKAAAAFIAVTTVFVLGAIIYAAATS